MISFWKNIENLGIKILSSSAKKTMEESVTHPSTDHGLWCLTSLIDQRLCFRGVNFVCVGLAEKKLHFRKVSDSDTESEKNSLSIDSKVDTKPCMRLFFFLPVPVLRVKSKSNLICCGICGIWPHFCSDGYLGLLSLLREYNKAPCRGLEPAQRDICLW